MYVHKLNFEISLFAKKQRRRKLSKERRKIMLKLCICHYTKQIEKEINEFTLPLMNSNALPRFFSHAKEDKRIFAFLKK